MFVPVPPRRPGESHSRHQVQLAVDVRLHLVTNADAERELVVQTDVVGPVEAKVVEVERRVHESEALRERSRLSEPVGLERAEGERACGVTAVEVLVLAAIEEEPDAHLLLASDVEIQVLGQLECPRRPLARHSGAALGEGVDHDDGRRARHRLPDAVLRVDLQPHLVKHALADDALCLCTQLVVAAFVVERPLWKIEAADAAVLGLALPAAVLETQRLVVGQRVLETHRRIRRVGRATDVVAETVAVFIEGDDGVGLVVAPAVEAEANRGLPLHHRSARAEIEIAVLFGRFRSRECVAGVHRVAAVVEAAVAAPLLHVRAGDDLDLRPAGVVVVGRKRIAAEANLTNLVARGQPAAAETVHLKDRARATGHRDEHVGQLVGILGQIFDLGCLERGAERVATAIVGRGRVADDDLLLHAGDLQRDRLIHRATAQGERTFERLEPFELDVQRDVAGEHRRRCGRATLIGRERHGDAGGGSNDDRRVRNARARFVNDDEPELRLLGVLRVDRQREENKENQQEPFHFVKVFPLKVGLIR